MYLLYLIIFLSREEIQNVQLAESRFVKFVKLESSAPEYFWAKFSNFRVSNVCQASDLTAAMFSLYKATGAHWSARRRLVRF